MRRMTLSTETLNKILSTLGQMPYSQVANLISEIQSDLRPEGDETVPKRDIPNPGEET